VNGDETAILRSGSEEVAKRGADFSCRSEGEEKAFFAERKRRKGDGRRTRILGARGAVFSGEVVWVEHSDSAFLVRESQKDGSGYMRFLGKVLILREKKNMQVLNSKTESRRDFDSEPFARRSQIRGLDFVERRI